MDQCVCSAIPWASVVHGLTPSPDAMASACPVPNNQLPARTITRVRILGRKTIGCGALHEVVGELVPPPAKVQLKWPNDLMVGGAKMAGILLEGTGDAVVLGIGVNLAQAPELPDRETIAMAQFGPAPDRDTFAERLAAQWKADLERWRTYGLAPLVNRWEAAAHPKGTRLAAEIAGEGRIAGTFDGLTEEGAARLRLDNGEVRAIHAGELSYA